MKVTVRLKGFRELDAALGELKKATARNVLRRAGMSAMEPVAEAMREKAPREEGDLKDALAVGSRRAKRTKKYFPDAMVEVYAGVSVVGGGMPPQATQQEFGNENHGPQAYARPGWEQERAATLDRVGEEIGTEIEKAKARMRRKTLRAGR